MKEVGQRMSELMAPVDQQLMMCDDTNELLMMACAMLQRSSEIFDQVIGPDGRKAMFKEKS